MSLQQHQVSLFVCTRDVTRYIHVAPPAGCALRNANRRSCRFVTRHRFYLSLRVASRNANRRSCRFDARHRFYLSLRVASRNANRRSCRFVESSPFGLSGTSPKRVSFICQRCPILALNFAKLKLRRLERRRATCVWYCDIPVIFKG